MAATEDGKTAKKPHSATEGTRWGAVLSPANGFATKGAGPWRTEGKAARAPTQPPGADGAKQHPLLAAEGRLPGSVPSAARAILEPKWLRMRIFLTSTN